MFCSKCGKKIEADTAFCRYCGLRQIGDAVDHQAEPPLAPPAFPPPYRQPADGTALSRILCASGLFVMLGLFAVEAFFSDIFGFGTYSLQVPLGLILLLAYCSVSVGFLLLAGKQRCESRVISVITGVVFALAALSTLLTDLLGFTPFIPNYTKILLPISGFIFFSRAKGSGRILFLLAAIFMSLVYWFQSLHFYITYDVYFSSEGEWVWVRAVLLLLTTAGYVLYALALLLSPRVGDSTKGVTAQ